jgi:hypothetical protein
LTSGSDESAFGGVYSNTCIYTHNQSKNNKITKYPAVFLFFAQKTQGNAGNTSKSAGKRIKHEKTLESAKIQFTSYKVPSGPRKTGILAKGAESFGGGMASSSIGIATLGNSIPSTNMIVNSEGREGGKRA